MKIALHLCAAAAAAAIATPVSTARADTGDHWCDQGWGWQAYDRIPVWIHPDLADVYLEHDGGTMWTDDELRREVEFILERFMMQAPSGMPPLYFAGFEHAGTGWDDPAGNGPGGRPGPGNIAVRPNLGIDDNPCASFQSGWVDDAKGVRLHMGITSGACTGFSEHWYYSRWASLQNTFGGTLAHELMHGLGFHHTDVCNTTYPPCLDSSGEAQVCGLMDTHGLGSEYFELEYADWDALISKYGGWENDGRLRRESANALDWSTLSAGSFASGPFAASTWSWQSTLMPIVATDAATLDPHVWRWERSTGNFTDWGVPYSFGSQHGQVSVAYKFGYLFAFHGYGQSPNDARKHGRYSYATAPNSWTTVYPSFEIHRHGVTGTYDHKSDRLIHVYRDRDNRILLSTSTVTGEPSAPSMPVALDGAANKAAYTPAIACGDASIAHNCILVWASAAAHGSGQQFRNLRWVQFFFDGTSFQFSNVRQSGYIMFGPPSVVYKGPSSSDAAFTVAWHNPGQCFFTLHKSAATSSSFVDEVQHCSGDKRHNGPPLLGSTNTNFVEAWTFFNTQD
jgi:hypothetical protein